jgi:hypothetical protein
LDDWGDSAAPAATAPAPVVPLPVGGRCLRKMVVRTRSLSVQGPGRRSPKVRPQNQTSLKRQRMPERRGSTRYLAGKEHRRAQRLRASVTFTGRVARLKIGQVNGRGASRTATMGDREFQRLEKVRRTVSNSTYSDSAKHARIAVWRGRGPQLEPVHHQPGER